MLQTTHISFKSGKEQRLKSRKLISQLFTEGTPVSSNPIRALYLFTPNEAILQAGFTASSRNFKRAVDRNRIKRLMREAYRLNKSGLETTLAHNNLNLVLFFVFTGRQVESFEVVSAALKKILHKLTTAAAGMHNKP